MSQASAASIVLAFLPFLFLAFCGVASNIQHDQIASRLPTWFYPCGAVEPDRLAQCLSYFTSPPNFKTSSGGGLCDAKAKQSQQVNHTSLQIGFNTDGEANAASRTLARAAYQSQTSAAVEPPQAFCGAASNIQHDQIASRPPTWFYPCGAVEPDRLAQCLSYFTSPPNFNTSSGGGLCDAKAEQSQQVNHTSLQIGFNTDGEANAASRTNTKAAALHAPMSGVILQALFLCAPTKGEAAERGAMMASTGQRFSRAGACQTGVDTFRYFMLSRPTGERSSHGSW